MKTSILKQILLSLIFVASASLCQAARTAKLTNDDITTVVDNFDATLKTVECFLGDFLKFNNPWNRELLYQVIQEDADFRDYPTIISALNSQNFLILKKDGTLIFNQTIMFLMKMMLYKSEYSGICYRYLNESNDYEYIDSKNEEPSIQVLAY